MTESDSVLETDCSGIINCIADPRPCLIEFQLTVINFVSTSVLRRPELRIIGSKKKRIMLLSVRIVGKRFENRLIGKKKNNLSRSIYRQYYSVQRYSLLIRL